MSIAKRKETIVRLIEYSMVAKVHISVCRETLIVRRQGKRGKVKIDRCRERKRERVCL